MEAQTQGQFTVEVRWSPAHEMVTSLGTYLNYPEQKLLDLGATWRRDVRRSLPAELARQLDELAGSGKAKRGDPHEVAQARMTRALIGLLSWASPADLAPPDFIAWAGRLSVVDLLGLIAANFGSAVQVPANLAAIHEQSMRLLGGWQDAYFAGLDPAILDGLRTDAAAKAALIGTMGPADLVEYASCGVVIEPGPACATVVLIPQYHSRPWNVFSEFGDRLAIYYSAEAWPAPAGYPSTKLLRLTRALDDESRLRLLAFLAGGARSFGAIAEYLGLAKSTTHHHMVALRAAGLVRVFTRYGSYLDRYALRREALAELQIELGSFINLEGSR